MTANLDWRRAQAKPARVLSWKEQRLDRAADNWIDHESLCRTPTKSDDRRPQKGKVGKKASRRQ